MGQKQKTEKKKEEEERERERLNDGENNGQATHGARKHAWRTQAAWANFNYSRHVMLITFLDSIFTFRHSSCHNYYYIIITSRGNITGIYLSINPIFRTHYQTAHITIIGWGGKTFFSILKELRGAQAAVTERWP